MTDLAWINGKITGLDEVIIPPEIIQSRPRRSFFCRERMCRIRSLANLDNDGDCDGGIFDGVQIKNAAADPLSHFLIDEFKKETAAS
jgi:hypothetical protein